jgi:hypothetical protein
LPCGESGAFLPRAGWVAGEEGAFLEGGDEGLESVVGGEEGGLVGVLGLGSFLFWHRITNQIEEYWQYFPGFGLGGGVGFVVVDHGFDVGFLEATMLYLSYVISNWRIDETAKKICDRLVAYIYTLIRASFRG